MDGRPVVLVVDDDEAIREATRLLLEEEGYVVEEARDGAEAMERLAAEPVPALILLDLMMPVMNGSAMLEALEAHADLSQIPVVIMTAAEARPETSSLRYPLLRKPFGIDALMHVVTSQSPRLWDDGEVPTEERAVVDDPAQTARARCVSCDAAAGTRCVACGEAYCRTCLDAAPDGVCAACWRARQHRI
jgi:CheY-like chemotaxis protein